MIVLNYKISAMKQAIQFCNHPIYRKIRGILSICKYIWFHGFTQPSWLLDYYGKKLGGSVSYKEKVPMDCNKNPLPWYTYSAIEYLTQFDYSKCTVFEYGSGNSSQFWAQRALRVTSVESDKDWYWIGNQNILSNQKLLLSTEQIDYINSIHLENTCYDVIVIDGKYRYNCAVEAVKRIKSGGIIILDNSDWFPNATRLLQEAGLTQIDFIGVGPVNMYSWSTSLFFQNSLEIPRIISTGNVKVIGGLVQVGEDDRLL
ncbi:hypothetical protein MchiMG62_18270 [Methanoculleus chikugoensis]|uniref:O-methyltransferase n=3 Tax=Methanoculleus chikugoensis TaxID=118126 RepID=A0ABM7H762_9EURY|nr:hypothetical protein MchiMG62_18270 [Methanoculleus chikugoensis]